MSRQTTLDVDQAQRAMTDEVERAARAFGLSFTERQMVFILTLASFVDQEHYEHPSLGVDDIVMLAASRLAANA